MKKLTPILVAALLVVTLSIPVFADGAQAKPFTNFTLVFNGQVQTFEESNPPLNLNGRTMLPLVYMFDLINADGTGKVEWNDEARMVSIEYHNTSVKLWIGNPDADVNGEVVSVGGAAPVIYGGRTYVPMSFLASNFDLTVHWDDASRTAFLIENDMLKEISDIMQEINAEFEGKMSVAADMDMDVNVGMGGLNQSINQLAEMNFELDMDELFMHVMGKVTVGELIQESEVYDDGEFTYTIAGDMIIKTPSTLSMAAGIESLIDTQYEQQQLVGLGLSEDKAGNCVISGTLLMEPEFITAMTNDLLEQLGAGDVSYDSVSIPNTQVAYVIDQESNEVISMWIKLNMDTTLTISGQKIDMSVAGEISLRDFDFAPEFNAIVPEDIKKEAISLEDLQ